MFSAFIPEYVSMRHLRYSLRQGRIREPCVAFHKNRMEEIIHALMQSIKGRALGAAERHKAASDRQTVFTFEINRLATVGI